VKKKIESTKRPDWTDAFPFKEGRQSEFLPGTRGEDLGHSRGREEDVDQ